MQKLTPELAKEIQLGLYAAGLEIILEKRRGYSGGADPYQNLRSAEIFNTDPITGTMIRINDKIKRMNSLKKRVQQYSLRRRWIKRLLLALGFKLDDEPIGDCFRDGVNYFCIIAGLFAEQNPDYLRELLDKAQRFDEIVEAFRNG